MENSELLAQVLAAIQEQTEVLTSMIEGKLQDAETRVNLRMENEITRRLDALTDGYKLNYEAQFELARRLEQAEHRIDGLEIAG